MKIDEIVFADTKAEFRVMYDYIDKIEKYIGRDITRLRIDAEFEDWAFGTWTRGKHEGQIRGMPYTLFPCYWARMAKIVPLEKVCKGNIRYIGIAADEPKRIKLHDGYVYPLVDWGVTEKDCLKYLQDRNLMNPLYEKVNRTGCWYCPKQSVASLKYLYDEHPAKWKKLKEWDRILPSGFSHERDLDQLESRFKREIYMERNQTSFLKG